MKFSPLMPRISNEEKLKIANEIVKKLYKIREVIAIILFGSQATGKARSDSDVDIAVMTKTNDDKIRSKIIREGDEIVQVSHFNTLPLEIQFRVIKEGKVLFCKDEDELKNQVKKTILRYLDFDFFLTKFYRRKLENV